MRRCVQAKIVKRKVEELGFSITYPYITGLKNKSTQRRINTIIRKEISRLLKQLGYPAEDFVTVTGDYTIHLSKKAILSLTLEIYAYREHYAHGMTYRSSLTINLLSGKLYQLWDLFKPRSDYAKVLSDIIKEHIKEREIPIITNFERIRCDQDYYMSQDDLVVYFQLYELAPYAWSFPEFIIPYAETKDILSYKGPAYRFLPVRND